MSEHFFIHIFNNNVLVRAKMKWAIKGLRGIVVSLKTFTR
jgi:hypothetical protein